MLPTRIGNAPFLVLGSREKLLHKAWANVELHGKWKMLDAW
jgi:hypothetical protein